MTPIMLLVAILVFTLIGCGFGIITGLVPGIHVNNVAHLVLVSQTVIVSMATMIFGWAGPSTQDLIIIISSLIIGTVITHTFLDFIPSVFLGAPDGDTALSVLPGHRMLMEGRGFEAVKCSVTGSFGAMIFALVLLIPLKLFIGQPVNAYSDLEVFIPYILICVGIFLILSEKAGAKEAFGFHDWEMEGFVLSGKIGPDKCAHDGIAEKKLDALTDDGSDMISVKGSVQNVLPESEDSPERIILRSGRKSIGVSLHRWNHRVPEAGDDVVVMGRLKPVPCWKSHLAKRAMALGIFLLSGFMGLVLLSPSGLVGNNIMLLELSTPDTGIILLFPMFTGLFGLSTLFLSLKDDPSIPEQKKEDVRLKIPYARQLRAITTGSLASISSLFPGVSSAIATMISVNLNEKGNEEEDGPGEFIMSVSAVNTSVGIFNLLALFIIMRSRSGAMKAVEAIMGPGISPWDCISNVPLELAALLLASLIASIVALWLTLKFGRLFATHFSKINYKKLIFAVVGFLVFMIGMFSGILGLAILAITTFMGFIPPLVGVKRVHLMGSLVVPVIVFLL